MRRGFILSTVFAVIVAIFAIQNAMEIEVNFLFARFTTSLAIIIFLSTALGGLIVMTLGIFRELKLKREIKSNKKIVVSLQGDIDVLEQDLKKKDEEIQMLKDDFLKKQEIKQLDSEL